MIMDELLQRLEKKIKDLIDQHDKLQISNEQLTSGKTSLAREKEMLLARQEQAIDQIKSLLVRLKAIESSL